MKKITFFNEKGGTGKTTFNVSFASWLAYEKGERVFVRDFDCPSNQIHGLRVEEIGLIQRDPEFVKLITQKPYPIAKEKEDVVIKTHQDRLMLLDKIRKESQGDGYYIMDFPGRLKTSDAMYNLAYAGLIDTIIFPIDSDEASQARAMYTYHILNHPQFLKYSGKEHQDAMFLWNRETRTERRGKRDYYSVAEEKFKDIGIPVCDNRIRELLSFRRDASVFGFIKSTVCFPIINIKRSAPWLIDVFEEVKERIDGTYAGSREIEELDNVK